MQPTSPSDPPAFPLAAYEQALGPQACAALRAAPPEPWRDRGVLTDCFVINAGAVAFWLYTHFGLNLDALSEAELDAIELDPLAETLCLGETRYLLPKWCYLSLDLLPGDPRPRHWPGIPPPGAAKET